MPDKQLTIATYAAGASLAAITLVYVFAPTFFIDGDPGGSAGGRKRGVVGLVNSANDCFINSVLQALAGLGDLRIYLIRETHRRSLDGKSVYTTLVDDPRRKTPAWKLEGLQRGMVTQGLKDMLDALNERPLYKKTISAVTFVRTLEDAFGQRISRQQQDAQEFLQVVAERLCDEYHAGHRARRARNGINGATHANLGIDEKSLDQQLSRLAIGKIQSGPPIQISSSDELPASNSESPQDPPPQRQTSDGIKTAYDDEEGFPLEGEFESQIECLTCGFKPKPSNSTFCTLTLNVPQVSSTTLNTCFDGIFKTEYIDDFKCEKCRLVHAVKIFQHEIRKSTSEKFKKTTQEAIDNLKEAIESDPEQPPEDVELPDLKFAPKRRIARHIRITKFPKIMAIHLSRSIFDAGRSSLKNSAKVSFPERLPLGGLLDQKEYKLLGLVTHKGSHNSGHYESFRRQNIYPPFSTPNTFDKSGVYSKSGTPIISSASTPQFSAIQRPEGQISSPSTPELLSPSSPAATPQTSSRVSLASSLSTPHPRPSSDSLRAIPNGRSRPTSGPTSAPRDYSPKPDAGDTNSIRSVARSARATLAKVPSTISHSLSRSSTPRPSSSPSSTGSHTIGNADNKENNEDSNSAAPASSGVRPRRRRTSDRWWRISDEKIKESKTSEVLGMQRGVYLLFYELEKGLDGNY
jgi:ubiquitin carboxyl-terminal hydrolase 16